jgi:hypothetical protein
MANLYRSGVVCVEFAAVIEGIRGTQKIVGSFLVVSLDRVGTWV